MFKTIAASLLALSLATSLAQAGTIFSSDRPHTEGVSDVFGGFTDKDDDSNPGDNFWNLPDRGPTIEINPHYQVAPRPTLDHYDPSLDFGLGGGKGQPVSYDKLAKLNVNLSLSCDVAGTPTEFPDDILIANTGLIEIPAGTKIVWQTKAPRLEGMSVLAKALKPGKAIRLDGVLAGGLAAGTPCTIKAIGA